MFCFLTVLLNIVLGLMPHVRNSVFEMLDAFRLEPIVAIQRFGLKGTDPVFSETLWRYFALCGT